MRLGDSLDYGGIDVEFGEDETMMIRWSPQHPSTHGVAHSCLEAGGRAVLRSSSIIGYCTPGWKNTTRSSLRARLDEECDAQSTTCAPPAQRASCSPLPRPKRLLDAKKCTAPPCGSGC